jgi:hypothetical protein
MTSPQGAKQTKIKNAGPRACIREKQHCLFQLEQGVVRNAVIQ